MGIPEFITMAVLVFISSVFNAVSIYLLSTKKRLRTVDFLVGNLCFCTSFMGFTFMALFSLGKVLEALGVSEEWICGSVNFVKYLPGTLVILSSFGISFERIKSLKHNNNASTSRTTFSSSSTRERRRTRQNSSSAVMWIFYVWLLACVLSLPAAWKVVPMRREMMSLVNFNGSGSGGGGNGELNGNGELTAILHPGRRTTNSLIDCQRCPLFGSKYADVLHELARFFFLNVMFSFHLIYELYLVRSKLKYIWVHSTTATNPRLRRKVFRVRFAFIYSLVLILIWLSTGAVILAHKVPFWFRKGIGRNNGAALTLSVSYVSGTSFNYVRLITFFYLFANPVAVFLCNEDVGWGFWGRRGERGKRGVGRKVKEGEGEKVDDDDVSRFETQRLTATDEVGVGVGVDVEVGVEEGEEEEVGGSDGGEEEVEEKSSRIGEVGSRRRR